MPHRPPLPGRTFAGLELFHPTNKGLAEEWACAPTRFGGAAMFGLKANTKGTLNGGVKWQPTSRRGGYGQLNFDGTGYIDFGVASATGPLNYDTQSFAFAFWLLDAQPADNGFIFSKSPSSGVPSYDCHTSLGGSSGFWGWRIHGAGGGTSICQASSAFNDGKWHFCVCAYDFPNLTMYLYIDGIQRAKTTGAQVEAVSNTTNFQIGARGGTPITACLMDGVASWGRYFSPSDQTALYDQTRRGNPDRWRWLSRTAWFLPTGGGGNNLTRTAADAPTTSDIAARVFTGTRTASDSPTTADAVVRTLMLFRTAVDAPSTADAATRAFVGHRTASDAPSTADTAAASRTFIRSAADNPATVDAASRVFAGQRTAADSPITADVATRAVTALRTASDHPLTTDSASAMRTYLRTVMDAPATLDAAVRVFTGLRTATDHPLTTDAAFATVIGPQQPPSEIIYLSWASGTPILASWSPGTPIMLSWQA